MPAESRWYRGSLTSKREKFLANQGVRIEGKRPPVRKLECVTAQL